MISVHYVVLDPSEIFGMIGRCGGGYNTVWEDWSPEGREARNNIIKEYEIGMDKICGHYAKLKDSVAKEGFRNPLIVTCGPPLKRQLTHLPPELRSKPKHEWLLLEGTTGGSRLWVAQELGIKVPCLINDRTGRFAKFPRLLRPTDVLKYYKDKPASLMISPTHGVIEPFDQTKVGYHLGPEWNESQMVKYRAPLWVSLMNKYGYYVDRLPPFVHDILKTAGIIQPINLKKKISNPPNI